MVSEQERKPFEKRGFRILLIFLLLYHFGSPFLAPYPSLASLAHISLSFTMLFSVYAVNKERRQRLLAMVLLPPVLVLYWTGVYDLFAYSRSGSFLLLALYNGLLVYLYALQIVRAKKITVDVLNATLCLYLIIGLFWGSLYALLHELSPGAYSGALLDNATGQTVNIFNYFSMVTLTTLGYGDITPQTPGAGALCQMEAIVGQFYTAVVVAWLVGNFVSENKEMQQY